MRAWNILVEHSTLLAEHMELKSLDSEMDYLVIIYTAGFTKEEAVSAARDLKSLFPHARIIGTSTSGVIYKGRQVLDGTLISIQEYENTGIITDRFTWADKNTTSMVNEILDSLEGRYVRFMHVLCGNHYYDAHNFIEEFNNIETGIHLAGGIAGDILPHKIDGYVFTPEGVVEDGIVIAALYGEALRDYQGVNIAHEPISHRFKLTSSEGTFWNTVNGEDSTTWMNQQLGVENVENYEDWQGIAANDTLIRFPVVLEGHNGASRFIRYDRESKRISQYFCHVAKDMEFRIGYVNPTECVKEALRICNEITFQPVESLFCYTCLFRRLYLHNCAEWEISPYKGTEVCGAFMMGEFAFIEERNEFLNGSCVLNALAENEVYIYPDFDVFDQLNTIQDDTRDLLNFVLKRQSQSASRYNEELLKKLMDQQEAARNQTYLDSDMGIENYTQYRHDHEKIGYSKLCMIKIENDELLTRHIGRERYISLIRDAIAQVKNYLQMMEINGRKYLHFYTFNDSCIFFATNEKMGEEKFIGLCRLLFERFQIIRNGQGDEALIARFVVVPEGEHLIDHGLNGLEVGKNLQTPFLICGNQEREFSTDEEFKRIGILTRALEGNGIIPYFQGIYDNNTRKLTKYEALMRIVDTDGTIYCPADFMEIAKKYHLYTHLSRMMMNKVFAHFKNRKETVSLNFSAYDINSSEMLDLIYEKLESLEDASNFILEVVEDVAFKDFTELKNFVDKVRGYGVKIAIDDFGVGYSSLLEIASIKPDFIKVDGTIVRSLPDSEVSRKLMDVIVYMGRLLDAEIVAEFVENKEIQDSVKEHRIRYSQGYYFSRPTPMKTVDGLEQL